MTSTAQVLPQGRGRFVLVVGAERTLAYAVRHGDATWVFIQGTVYVIDAPTASGSRNVRHDDDTSLAAPMPATVVSINVAAGQAVKTGDVLITLEAMKMELTITSPRDGKVQRVACRVGELVQPGVPLLDLE